MLAAASACIDTLSHHDFTPIAEAAKRNGKEVIECLLGLGAKLRTGPGEKFWPSRILERCQLDHQS